MPQIRVALCGQPNTGKTTIFNQLVKTYRKVGNYPGVTIEKFAGRTSFEGVALEFVDLPGLYSLTPYSAEEKLACRYLTAGEFDVIVAILDGTALERGLVFVAQLMELNRPLIIVINMMDLVRKKGFWIDLSWLSDILAAPVMA